MPQTPGTRLGPYEIVAPLGAGGMGEVYRARDTRLGRDVAIKVLPQHLSADPEVRARFEREARTVSSLNHPHICTLHDVGRAGDIDYLVMELVEGETLAQRIGRGALPTAEVLRLGAQIADALDRAHRAGVTHRDLKPGNVMLAKGGAKLMDFGLARIAASAVTATGDDSPTIDRTLTTEGAIIGTFQYMAPEQLMGKDADTRSDLWALGCVLYEMATGRRAFEGSNQASLIGAILHTEPPPVSQVTPLLPQALDRLVAACLAKDPAERVQSAHDVRLQLEWMGDGTVSASGASVPARLKARRPRWIELLAVGLAVAALTALVVTRVLPGRGASAGGGTAERYVVCSADLQKLSAPALSPDGSFVVFSAREGQNFQLFRRNLSSFEMTPISGTEKGSSPFFSPDGAWIGFMTADAVKKVPAGGGLSQVIVATPRPQAGDWGRDGMIYFTSRDGGRDKITALARAPATGGRAEVVAVLDTASGEAAGWLPEILPDGKTVLISIDGGSAAWRVVAVRSGGTRHDVVQNGLLGRFVSGHLLYVDSQSLALLSAPLDPAKAAITGSAIPLTEQIDPLYGFDATADGKLAYVPQPGAGQGDEVVWLDRKGAASPAMDTRGPWTQPRVSPDGKRVLMRRLSTECELWILDVGSKAPTQFVHGKDNEEAVWSPDGRRVAYSEEVNTPVTMLTRTVDGAREVQTLARGPDAGEPQSWSAGGNLLAYSMNGRGTGSDIWVRPMDGASPGTPFLATEFNEEKPSISPDGRWIAYASNETGDLEVFVRPYPNTGQSWQISTGGGICPLWSRDGRELFFISGTKMMSVPIETRPTFRPSTPVTLFEGGFSLSRLRDFDVAPDGRFVVVRHSGGGAGLPELRMLLNWQHEMKRVAGAAK